MIFNRRWHQDTYDYGREPGEGPTFFLGGAAADEHTPVVVIGGVRTAKGWLLFAQLPHLYDDPGYGESPRTVSEYLEFTGQVDDPVMGIIFDTDCPGWEWDVVGNALEGAPGYTFRSISNMAESDAKAALLTWTATLDLRIRPKEGPEAS